MTKSDHTLDGSIIKLHTGLAIYKTHASPYWNARILDRNTKKYIVRSTKETSRVIARTVAEELEASLKGRQPTVHNELTFKYYATRFISRSRDQAAIGERNANYIRTAQLCLDNDEWGLMKRFASRDVRELKTRHFCEFMESVRKSRPDLSSSTLNMLCATFRNVLKVAREDGVIDDVPNTPRTGQKDKPRPFFRFFPLVPKERDAYKNLLNTAKAMATEGLTVRGVMVTDELYDLILFVVHSFVRPTTTELYALRHNDVEIAENPKRLIVTVRNGKTGFRMANTMPACVSVYQRIKQRYPNAKREDYLFLPNYPNRETASRIIARQFNEVLERANIKHDPSTNTDLSVYSLRHTAICMRIIKSKGQVNIYNLAKNAGTSVDQIERFYARNLPLSAEMALNLHSMGAEQT